MEGLLAIGTAPKPHESTWFEHYLTTVQPRPVELGRTTLWREACLWLSGRRYWTNTRPNRGSETSYEDFLLWSNADSIQGFCLPLQFDRPSRGETMDLGQPRRRKISAANLRARSCAWKCVGRPTKWIDFVSRSHITHMTVWPNDWGRFVIKSMDKSSQTLQGVGQ